MRRNPRGTHQGETDGSTRNAAQKQRVEDGNAQIPHHSQVELGFTADAGLKLKGHFANLQPPTADGQQFIKKLKTIDINLSNIGKHRLKPTHKKTAHIVGQLAIARQAEASHRIGPCRISFPFGAEAPDLGLRVEATADQQISACLLQTPQSGQHRGRFMLPIAIHDHDQIPRGIQNAFLDGTGQSRAAHAANQAHLRMDVGKIANDIRGAVLGIVINKDDL